MVDYIKSLTPLTPSGRARVLFSMSAHSPAPRRGPCSPIASGFDFWSATFVFQDLRPHTHAQIAQLKSPAVGSTVPGFRQTLAVGASSGHWLRPRAGRTNRRRRCRCRRWRTMTPRRAMSRLRATHNLQPQPGPCCVPNGPPGCHGERGRARAAATLRIIGPRWPPRAPPNLLLFAVVTEWPVGCIHLAALSGHLRGKGVVELHYPLGHHLMLV